MQRREEMDTNMEQGLLQWDKIQMGSLGLRKSNASSVSWAPWPLSEGDITPSMTSINDTTFLQQLSETLKGVLGDTNG